MTKDQFDTKVRRFCILIKIKGGYTIGEKYLREELFKFYSRYRFVPKLSFKEGSILMNHPETGKQYYN